MKILKKLSPGDKLISTLGLIQFAAIFYLVSSVDKIEKERLSLIIVLTIILFIFVNTFLPKLRKKFVVLSTE